MVGSIHCVLFFSSCIICPVFPSSPFRANVRGRRLEPTGILHEGWALTFLQNYTVGAQGPIKPCVLHLAHAIDPVPHAQRRLTMLAMTTLFPTTISFLTSLPSRGYVRSLNANSIPIGCCRFVYPRLAAQKTSAPRQTKGIRARHRVCMYTCQRLQSGLRRSDGSLVKVVHLHILNSCTLAGESLAAFCGPFHI